ncbi:MAG: bifunctional phosphopantothenoylcysteine decarboxylase/phosphopantothenate--cysteine ligase CoaBC [Deltaproteobacteria bacterium]|nr:MAG: bifunctional phosphopantothenoylcysteine decarboxylase/phosphopantothenate--cysteine ligase CoaBC [Deltaproteobacteria bacterium]
MQHNLTQKHILLGVTGGIAAYKSVELVRRLRESGAEVRVVMTAAAQEFITPLTLQAVSGQRVYTTLLDSENEFAMGHIELARWAEFILIAPATADFLAKLAYGHANDLLSTICLATTAQIIVAPAMNQQMWNARSTQENYQRLQSWGVRFFGPGNGLQACGEQGLGRMLEPLELVSCLQTLFQRGPLEGHSVLITAGPTREPLDPIRFISNRSSGRMGYAIAEAAQLLGAQVTLISGPVCLTAPLNVNIIPVSTAQEMRDTVMSHIDQTAIFIACAAVADYRPVHPLDHKLKKQAELLEIVLERTPDILSEVAHLHNPPFTVGFAAETHDLAHYARDKLLRKNLDLIAANQVGLPDSGFESEENALKVIWKTGEIDLPRCAKTLLAKQLLNLIVEHYFQSPKLHHSQPN